MSILGDAMSEILSDLSAPRYPVSVKAVVRIGSRIPLLKNERDEWELPGGKLEPGDQPSETIIRELEEELGVSVRLGPLISSWVLNIQNRVDVLIITYACEYDGGISDFVLSHEHKELGVFTLVEAEALNMPEGYKEDIRAAFVGL